GAALELVRPDRGIASHRFVTRPRCSLTGAALPSARAPGAARTHARAACARPRRNCCALPRSNGSGAAPRGLDARRAPQPLRRGGGLAARLLQARLVRRPISADAAPVPMANTLDEFPYDDDIVRKFTFATIGWALVATL